MGIESENKKESANNQLEIIIKKDLENIYNNFNPEERKSTLLQRLQRRIFEGTPLAKVVPYENLLNIIDEVKKIDTSADLPEFIDKAYKIIAPLVELQSNHPELIKEADKMAIRLADKGRLEAALASSVNSKELRDKKKQEINESENKFFLSETLIGEITDDKVKLHIAPARDLSLIFIMKDIKLGLRKLADYLIKNQKVSIVEGQSWIITDHPGLLERFGFKVIEQDKGESIAQMSRRDLIEKYYK